MLARPATPDDAEELVRLREVMLRTLHTSEWDDDWREPALKTLRDQLTPTPTPPALPASPPPTLDASTPTALPASTPAVPGTSALAAFVVDRPGGGLASCALGTIQQRLGGPGNPTGLSGYVYSVCTDEDQRRRGYSRACLTALLQWFRDQGIAVVDLNASVDGLHLYESLGFTRKADPALRLRF